MKDGLHVYATDTSLYVPFVMHRTKIWSEIRTVVLRACHYFSPRVEQPSTCVLSLWSAHISFTGTLCHFFMNKLLILCTQLFSVSFQSLRLFFQYLSYTMVKKVVITANLWPSIAHLREELQRMYVTHVFTFLLLFACLLCCMWLARNPYRLFSHNCRSVRGLAPEPLFSPLIIFATWVLWSLTWCLNASTTKREKQSICHCLVCLTWSTHFCIGLSIFPGFSHLNHHEIQANLKAFQGYNFHFSRTVVTLVITHQGNVINAIHHLVQTCLPTFQCHVWVLFPNKTHTVWLS